MRLTKCLHVVMKAVVVLTLSAASTQATVTYDFVGTGEYMSEPVGFELTAPDYVNPPVNSSVGFSCADLDSSTNCYTGVPDSVFFINNGGPAGSFGDQIDFYATNNASYAFFFPSGAFGAPGVYGAESGTGYNPATLTVTQTPEPSTMMLLALSGFCLCGLGRSPTRLFR